MRARGKSSATVAGTQAAAGRWVPLAGAGGGAVRHTVAHTHTHTHWHTNSLCNRILRARETNVLLMLSLPPHWNAPFPFPFPLPPPRAAGREGQPRHTKNKMPTKPKPEIKRLKKLLFLKYLQYWSALLFKKLRLQRKQCDNGEQEY